MPLRLRHAIVALLIVLIGSAPALASPEDVIADFRERRPVPQVIDKAHSWSDLRGAVELVQTQAFDRPFQEQFADEVQRVIARDYLGLETTPPSTLDSAVLPSWVIAVATASFILVVAGIATAIWRRVRPLR